MIVNERRRDLMKEFIDTRLMKSMEDRSAKFKTGIDKNHMILPESEFHNVARDILSSMEEYFVSGVWNEKDLV